jgi:integrase
MTRAYKRGTTWYIDFVDSTGKRQRIRTACPTKASAEKLAAEMQLRADRARKGLGVEEANPEGLTLRAAAQWWLAHHVSKRSAGKMGPSIQKHLVRGALGPLPLEQVTPGKAASFLAVVAKETSEATANHVHAYLSGVFSTLERHGRFHGANPMRKVRRYKLDEAQANPWPAWCVPLLIEHAPTPGWRVGIALAAYTGMRRGEIERLRGGDVDLKERIIKVGRTKTGAARRVGIHKELLAILREHAGKGSIAEAGWNKSAVVIRDAAKRAGISADIYEAHTFHDLRDTWTSQMRECDARTDVIEFMGWGKRKSSVMRSTYLAFADSRLREETDKLSWPTAEADVIDIKKGRA